MATANLSITRRASLREALAQLEQTALGILLLVRDDGIFERTVTDGDLRRLILGGNSLDASLAGLPEIQSLVIGADHTRRDALDLMNKGGFNHLPVVDANDQLTGIVTIGDVVKTRLDEASMEVDSLRHYVMGAR